MTGRPSKFSKKVVEDLIEAKRVGASNQTACAYARISDETLRRWLERGKNAEEGTPWRQFHDDFRSASIEPNLRALTVITKRMEDDKPEFAWKFVERKEPGFEPPMPHPQVTAGPIVIQLAFGNGQPMSELVEGEIVDAKEVPAGPRALPDATPSPADRGPAS